MDGQIKRSYAKIGNNHQMLHWATDNLLIECQQPKHLIIVSWDGLTHRTSKYQNKKTLKPSQKGPIRRRGGNTIKPASLISGTWDEPAKGVGERDGYLHKLTRTRDIFFQPLVTPHRNYHNLWAIFIACKSKEGSSGFQKHKTIVIKIKNVKNTTTAWWNGGFIIVLPCMPLNCWQPTKHVHWLQPHISVGQQYHGHSFYAKYTNGLKKLGSIIGSGTVHKPWEVIASIQRWTSSGQKHGKEWRIIDRWATE